MRRDSSLKNRYVVMHTHLNFVFKWPLHFSTLAIKLFNIIVVLSHRCKRDTMNHSPFKCFATHATHPLLKLMCLINSKGWVKHLFLLYKRLIRPYFSLLWQCISPLSTCTTHPLLKLKRFVLLVMKGM